MKNLNYLCGLSGLIIIFFLGTINVSEAQSSIGKPRITNYSYQDYNAGPVNWWATEDDRGIMYFANGQGILEYDGENWRVIKTDKGGTARSLCKDDKGRIFAGGNGEIGYLAKSKNNELSYVSLLDKVPDEHKSFADVWECDFWNGSVYFRTSNKIYIWNGKEMKVLVSDDAFHTGKIINDEYYVRIWNRGLCKLVDDEFELVPGGEQFADERIYEYLPYEDKILIGTRTRGFFLYDGKSFTPFKTEIDDLIKGNLYLPGIALDDDRFIINTFANGAFILDKNGKLLQEITQANGLQDNSVDYVFKDSRGVLWLMLFNGLASVNLNSEITKFDQTNGLPSNVVFTMTKWKGRYYAGTNNGIFYMNEGENNFTKIDGTNGQVSNFHIYKNRLFVGTGGMGLVEIVGTDYKYVRRDDNYDFRVSIIVPSNYDENRLYLVLQGGIASVYFNEQRQQYEVESITKKYNPGFSGFEEEKDGRLWISGSGDVGMWRLIPSFNNGKLDLESSEAIEYNKNNGLPDVGGVNFWAINDSIVVFDAPAKRTLVYNPSNDRFEEREVSFKDNLDFDNSIYMYPVPDKQGRTWFNAGGGVTVRSESDEGVEVYNNRPFLEIQDIPLWFTYIEEGENGENDIRWFTGPDGILRYDGDLDDPYIPEINVNIRQILLNNDSTIYSGIGDLASNVTIANKLNSVTFNYASPFFVNNDYLQYQTKMEGLKNSDWSPWTQNNEREYLNLPAGNYAFHVRAKSVYDTISDEQIFEFKIMPPWYSSWWAYLLYIVGAIGLVYAIVKNRTHLLKERQKILEEAVTERTKEVQLRVEELATVNEVSRALTEKLEMSELINLVGDKLKELFKANIVYLAIHDEKTGIINFPYQEGDEMQPLKFGEGLTSQIIKTGESLLINTSLDKEYDSRGLQRVGKKAASYLGVPIEAEDKVIGVISVQSTEHENRFEENDKRLLKIIARNFGIAWHNAELYEEAKIAKAAAEDANEAKSAFLSTVSHELRTPLTSVLGFAKIIRKKLEDRIFPAVTIEDQKIKKAMKQVSENLNVVVAEGERLTNLINDVLDLAKIESGRMEWEMKPIFVQDVLNRAISSTSSLFEQKNLDLEKTIPENLPLINGDQDKLIQVVINLLSNSVKFTDKGKVSIEAYEESGQIIVEIQDTGIGISEDDKSKVFERFRQAGDTLTDKPKGTGLGLPICREIIEKHGGIIWMKSELGVGSTFFFSLPKLGENTPIFHLDKIVTSLKKQISHSAILGDHPAHLLVVDDDTPIRSLLNQELSDAGYQVSEASNGKQALDMIRVKKPDLIILDVMMPEINGFDVAAVLKNDPDTMDIPIIILSIVEDKERGFKIGVDRYLTKPIDTEKLFHEIDILLEQGVSKKKVLVVDENSSTIQTLTEVLSTRGYKVMETNGDNLIDVVVEEKPNIIMLNSIYNIDPNTLKHLKFQNGMENVLFFVYD